MRLGGRSMAFEFVHFAGSISRWVTTALLAAFMA
jgi:hypothetical protein